jgi:hypothetical protein
MYCTAGPAFFGTYCTVSVNRGLLQYFYGHSLEIVDYLDYIFSDLKRLPIGQNGKKKIKVAMLLKFLGHHL